jgi:CheY-like chemotaxis protein
MLSDIRFVENGAELMDYLHRRGIYSNSKIAPRPDLILLDLHMPLMDGREALNRIVSNPDLRDIPVVILSLSEDEKDIRYARSLGVNLFTVKPASFESLVEVMRTISEYWFKVTESQRGE